MKSSYLRTLIRIFIFFSIFYNNYGYIVSRDEVDILEYLIWFLWLPLSLTKKQFSLPMYVAVVNPHFILYSWCWWKLHIGEVDSLVNWRFDYSKKNMIYANNLEHCPCHFTVFPLSFYGSKPRQNNMTTWVGSICMRTMESETHLCRAPPEFTMQLIFWTYPFWSQICVLSIVCMPLMTYLLSFSIVDCWVFFLARDFRNKEPMGSGWSCICCHSDSFPRVRNISLLCSVSSSWFSNTVIFVIPVNTYIDGSRNFKYLFCYEYMIIDRLIDI
jgi:hypothetical protein